jgi:ABC-type Fe3+-siderophore transport system permease subunit
MKRWQAVVTALLALGMLVLLGATAHAQSFAQLPPLLAAVVTKTAVIVDGVLSHWVTGNTLTDPQSYQLVAGIAQTVVSVTHFFANLVVLFSS